MLPLIRMSSNVIYEVAIAKKEFFGAGYTAKDDKDDITLSVELNGLSHSETGDAKTGGYHGGNENSGDANGGEENMVAVACMVAAVCMEEVRTAAADSMVQAKNMKARKALY